MGKKILFYLAVMPGCLLYTSLNVAQTLEEVLAKSLTTNPDVLAAGKRVTTEEYNYREIRGRYLPSIDLNATAGREWSNNPLVRSRGTDGLTLTRTELGITLTQLLFDGFETRYALQEQQSQINAASYQLADVREVVALRTVEVYLDVLRREELLDLAEENLEKHEAILEKIKLLSESGAGRKVNYTQTEGRYALASTNVLLARQNLEDARSSYLRVVGELPYDLVQPPGGPQLPVNLEAALNRANEEHPAIMAAREQVEASRSVRDQAKSSYLPRVDVELGASQNNKIDGLDGVNEDARVLVRMQYNLYRGGADRARVLSSEEQISESLERLVSIQRAVEEEVRLAWNALDNVRSRLEYLEAHRDRTLEVREGYEKQFGIGKRTLLDLLDIENEYFRARSDYVTGKYTEIFGTYRVLGSFGVISRLVN